jgi:hypothetical protein
MTENYGEFFNISTGLDQRRNWSKVFWQNPWVYWVVVRKTYIKEKLKENPPK